ncbi:MAG: class C sortase [Clostridia bacterium]|nr:class C sortase [Clostridia bacterium]
MKKSNLTTILLIIIFLVGLSLLLYPTVSDYWNSLRQSQAVTSYADAVASLQTEDYTAFWNKAVAYNESLTERNNNYLLSEEQKVLYETMLKVSEHGAMGYIEIPSIACTLPVYHGTDEKILQIAIGHLEWTSLPVGGNSTHCVLSGHRGLPGAKLFTNLDKLVIGDIFMLKVLNEVLTYEVDNIAIVEPDEAELLHIEENKDYCTLVTCTPYGINSHRLLVRGHRIDNSELESTARVTADAMQIEPMMVATIMAVPLIILFMMILLLTDRKKNGGTQDEDE